MMQRSDAEIKALDAKIKTISSKEKVHLRSVLDSMRELASVSSELRLFLHEWVSRFQAAESVKKISASETTKSEITEIFGLGEEQLWNLVEEGLVEVPSILKRYLQDLDYALYDEDSEATCRIAVDIMLIQCRKYLRKKHQSAQTSHNVEATIANATNTSTPVVNKLAVESPKRVRLFPEASLSIQMCDPYKPHRKILVSGRADWAFGYSRDGEEGALLAAIEAKQRSEYSKGRVQLIAYLAILRENRLRAEKTNVTTQGFYSDGSRYEFISIAADGTINLSRTFDTRFASDLKTVFNFIITMMETAMKSTPIASLTKPGRLQEKEVSQFKDEVWLRVFRHMEEARVVGPDDDMEDVIDW